MKKRLITYGIFGLIECQVVIKIGNKSKMKVSFSDGSTTASGVKPATFTTDNYIIQHAIEHSSDYKGGRIHTVSSIELNEDIKIERNKETTSPVTPQSQATAPLRQGSTEPLSPQGGTPPISQGETRGELNTATQQSTPSPLTPQSYGQPPYQSRGAITPPKQGSGGELETSQLGTEDGSIEKVQVSDLSEAKEYLAERFGINRSLLRSKKAITEHAMAHNIEFEGI